MAVTHQSHFEMFTLVKILMLSLIYIYEYAIIIYVKSTKAKMVFRNLLETMNSINSQHARAVEGLIL